MIGFRILKDPNYLYPKYMRAKCCRVHAEFLIRLELDKDSWCMVYAFKPEKISPENNFTQICKEFKFDNGLFAGSNYACPYCGNKNIVRCGSCGRITCNSGNRFFKCEYCKNSGEIHGGITSTYIETPTQFSKK